MREEKFSRLSMLRESLQTCEISFFDIIGYTKEVKMSSFLEDSKKLKLGLKLFCVAAAGVVALFGIFSKQFSPHKISAFSSGPPPSYTGAPGEFNCTECHSGEVNSGPGVLTISGVPSNYVPNKQYQITVTLSQQGAVLFGFQLTAIDNQGRQAGSFSLIPQPPQQTQIVQGSVGGNQRFYVQHTSAGTIPTQFDTKSWTFIWNSPSSQIGRVRFFFAGNAADGNGSAGGDSIYTNSRPTFSGTLTTNFDADTKSDIAVFRPSNGTWYVLRSSDNSFQAVQFGTNGDKPIVGDFDGDGTADFAVFRPSDGAWYLLRSSAGFTGVNFGLNGDIPVSGDFDGDGKTDVVVFRPSNGVWYILRSSDGGFSATQFGANGDKPSGADFDGDGKTDIAVFRPSNGVWYILQSSNNQFTAIQFGTNGDQPVPADYDDDGKADLAVFRPSNGTWYFLRSTAGFTAVQFGSPTDRAAPADFDGDGKTDIAVFRNGTWYLLMTTNGFSAVNFGTSGDIPASATYFAQ
ncbi:MAG: hypothetical protein D6687_07725 [Acidobacteria bacterium]|jgi:hypothetical protein|nr:MAG: hypothetical protein D6687_07725 [Acidobacteriota bacterium]GIU81606.1 MAG: hypothetical protein KatS3mg006_0670 [Pyrinomonadaceae bacterium]